MSKRHIHPLKSDKPELHIQWLSRKYGNFTCGKIYLAVAKGKHISKNQYSNYNITDDEGDNVTLDERFLNKKYKILS